jgi:hypothetical protein
MPTLFDQGTTMRFQSLALVSLLACAAIPAHAAYTTYEYAGIVTRLYAPPGPSDPTDITASSAACLPGSGVTTSPGSPPPDCTNETNVTYSITYDPSRLQSFGALTLPNAVTGVPETLYPGLASLYGDPLASYTITVAPPDGNRYVFTLADDGYDGYVTPAGVGPYPAVSFNGTQFMGLESDAYVGDLEFYSDPARFLLQEQRYNSYVYSTDPDSDFAFGVSTSLDGSLVAIREASQVPEPATCALLFGGLAIAIGSRRKRKSNPVMSGQRA